MVPTFWEVIYDLLDSTCALTDHAICGTLVGMKLFSFIGVRCPWNAEPDPGDPQTCERRTAVAA